MNTRKPPTPFAESGASCVRSVKDCVTVKVMEAEETVRASFDPDLVRGAEPTRSVAKINLAFVHYFQTIIEHLLGVHGSSLLSGRLVLSSRNIPLTPPEMQVLNTGGCVGMATTDTERAFYLRFSASGRIVKSRLTELSDYELAKIIDESEGLLKAALFEQAGRENDQVSGVQ